MKDIRTKQDFKEEMIKDESITATIKFFLKEGKDEASIDAVRLGLQQITELEKLKYFCNDLSLELGFKGTNPYDAKIIYIDDVSFINTSYALASLISAVDAEYVNAHTYLLFNDKDLLELVTEVIDRC